MCLTHSFNLKLSKIMNINITNADIKRLHEAYKSRNLVIFVGAGVSMNSGLPSWWKLISKLIDELPEKYKIDDDKLKIAQIYKYNRGEKEYLDKVRKELKFGKVTPNALHKAIFDLNPAHIVTTNYDNLIEQAAINETKQYYPISKNEDLVYADYHQYIIKMHGDLREGNIVLTEQDYLDYSDNFPLIETFVKSLFTTKIILFVGFSFSDYNLKIITRKVKNILSPDFQQMYLLNIGETDNLARHYFKEQGVNFIDYQPFIKNVTNNFLPLDKTEQSTIKNAKGLKLYQFLKYIQYFDHVIQKQKGFDIIDEIYNTIEDKFSELRIIDAEKIAQLYPLRLKNSYNDYSDGCLELENSEILALRKKLKGSFKEKRKFLKRYGDKYKKILEFAAINRIYCIYQKGFEVDKSKAITRIIRHPIDVLAPYYKLDFETCLKTIDNLKLKSKIEVSIADLDFPYLQYKMGQYLSAYLNFRRLSKKSWVQKKYIIYFICKYNMKRLGKFAGNSDFWITNNLDIDGIQYLREETRKIDLDYILNSIQIKEKFAYSTLNELKNYTFVLNSLHYFDEHNSKIKKSKINAEEGGVSSNSLIESISDKYLNLWNLCNNNYIISENFIENKTVYAKTLESVLVSNNIPNNSDKGWQTSKVHQIGFHFMIISILNIDNNVISEIIDKNKTTKINISQSSLNELLKVSKNLFKSFKNIPKKTIFLSKLMHNCLSNLLLFFSLIDLDDDKLKSLTSALLDIQKGTIKNQRQLLDFVISHREKIGLKFIESLLFKAIKERKSFEKYKFNDRLLNGLLQLIEEKNTNYTIQNTEVLNILVSDELIQKRITNFYFSFKAFQYYPDEFKIQFESLVNNRLEKDFSLNMFYLSHAHDVKLNKDFYNVFISKVEIISENTFRYPNWKNYIRVIKWISLEEISKVLRAKIETLKAKIPYLHFLINMETYSDFSALEKNWFYYLNDDIERLKLNTKAIEKLKLLIRENPTDKRLINTLLLL